MTDIAGTALLAVLIFAAALLYSTVGHAGASGYLAAMALLGIAPAVMRPTALTLNVFVAIIASVKFIRAGCFSWPLFWPFALTSIPAAYLGGRIVLPSDLYRVAVGLVLLYAAVRLFRTAGQPPRAVTGPPARPIALLLGAAIGLLSGLTGVGGGIFISPLLLFMGWAEMRQASGVAALFILVNSAAALLGNPASLGQLPAGLAVWLPAALVGGWLGAEHGSRRLATPVLRKWLAVVLVVAGVKLIVS
ncbi:MAG: putative permease [Gemmatimonadetes bacterium]|jgi:hypothetical protein|nr:putative permease [Gemmatimonadota bacterium]